MASERILITGANGFVGANITRRFYDIGVDVIPAIRPSGEKWRIEDLPLSPLELDVTDIESVRETIRKTKPTHIVNLATYGVYRDQKNTELIYKTNVLGITNILEVSKDLPIDMVINTGSVFEYGSVPGQVMENVRGDIRGPYDEAKMTSTDVASKYYKEFGLPVVTLRLFTAYGPYEDSRRLVASTILKALGDQEIIISPNAVRDFVYINDIADAYWKTIFQKTVSGEIINIGSGQKGTVGEVVQSIIDITGSKSTVLTNDSFAPTNDSCCWANIDKARKLIDWSPHRSIEEGLQETIEWYKTNTTKYGK